MDAALYRLIRQAERWQRRRNLHGTRHIYYKTVLEDFEKVYSPALFGLTTSHTHEFTYRSRLIPFVKHSKPYAEFAFACVAQSLQTKDFYVYYVSEAYNINTALQVPIVRPPISARFICAAYWDACELDAIAEEPAVAFTDDAENVYLQMRKVYDPGKFVYIPRAVCS